MNKQSFFFLLLLLASMSGWAQSSLFPIPKPHQLKWHEAEMGAVFHYDLHVFDGIRYGQGNNRINPIEDYNIFNPTQLNTDQWVQAAKAAGCKFAVLTATHETGFGLWQSDVNPYCLKAVKWRDGKGDIVRDFVNSCRKYGLQPGIYIGIRWNSLFGIHNFKAEGEGAFAKNRQTWYKHLCERMVEEICTRYGDLYMIWFDGGADDPHGDGPDVEPIVNKYQPNCLFYHNIDRADFRWGGSESGTVEYPCWSTFPAPCSHHKRIESNGNQLELMKHGDRNGRYWVPAMADTPLRGANGRHEWFWEPDDEANLYSVNALIEKYEKSVGRNATLIIGLTPDPTGLLPAGDTKRLQELGTEINRRYGSPLAQIAGQTKSLTLKLHPAQTVDACIIQENIAQGERIGRYRIEAKVNGKWQTVCNGQSVGHKRIERFSPVTASALRLTVLESLALPNISNFSAFFTESKLTQGSYLYQRGKSFQEVNAYPMEHFIDLSSPSAPVRTETAVPYGQATLSYAVSLPPYVRGVFFSRDARPGDHEWPNNTNRLLPWTFQRLTDLTLSGYPGIPSNAGPSKAGDALLLQCSDGNYLFAKALSGANSLSWFQVQSDGALTLRVSTLGEDALSEQAPLLITQTNASPYNALQLAYQTLIADKNLSALQARRDKKYFEAFDYLGWCTWEHYHFDIDEAKVLSDISAIEVSGIPVRYVLIDDGSVSCNRNQLNSLEPLFNRFPSGWGKVMQRKNKEKIRWIGLWQALSGYWTGISADNDFPANIQRTLYPHNGSLLPGKSKENIQTFYHYYVQTLKDYGFDFLKIDNQSFTLPLYMGGTQAVRQATDCQLAVEQETHDLQMGLMNCMAQNVINTDHTLYSATARVSIDYKKYDADRAKSHLFQSYANTLLQGQTVWPDHDMFHSSDSVCGSLMARSKALSGGPVYLSDAPRAFVKETILPLIDESGKLFRPLAPAIPTPESILINPLQEGKAYRVFAPTGDEAVSLICYNLNVSSQHQKVIATLGKADYLLRETFTDRQAPKAERMVLFDWQKQTAQELTDNYSIELTGFTDRLFHLCPIRNGWAVIGIQEKYLSPATVHIIASTPQKLVLQVHCAGTLYVWSEANGKQELRSIPVKAPGKIELTH